MSIRTARAFKLGRPDARLSILAPTKLSALWKAVPEVDEVITFEPGESIFSIAKKIRGRFDVSVLFPNSLRSALEVWLAGIPRRVGFPGHFRGKLLNQTVRATKKSRKPVRPEHHADRYWRLAEGCGGIEPPPLSFAHPAQKALVFGVCPGAEYGPAKRWPTASFRKAMEIVSAQIPCSWVILGTATDQPLATEILKGFSGKATDLTGQTSLQELIEKIQSLAALLTNDTGTMHLADFLGVPLVAVFGSTEPALTGPRSKTSHVLRHQVECSPCFLRDCPLDFRCMRAVTAEEAAGAMLRMV
jgi:heptosyltransferase-2